MGFILIWVSVFGYGMGKVQEPRIVGGSLAAQGEFPYIVSLRYRGSHYCGGSLIHPQIVMTAAHCLERIKPDEVWLGGTDFLNPNSFEQIPVRAIRIHPYFFQNTLRNDIALVVLARNSSLSTVAMNTDPSREDAGTGVTVAGWGTEDSNAPTGPNQLMEAGLQMVKLADCMSYYSSGLTPGQGSSGVYPGMICANAPGKDSCQGDSGGPLVWQSGKTVYQVGIVSFGEGCAQKCFPGVYTQVSAYRCFILHMTNDILRTDYYNLSKLDCQNWSVGEEPFSSNAGVTPSRATCNPSVIRSIFSCFPSSATVELEDGTKRSMSQVRVGDRVHVGGGKFSDIFAFTHRDPQSPQRFIRLTTEANRSLTLAPGHMLPQIEGTLKPASEVSIDSQVHSADGTWSRVTSHLSTVDRGLYNPHTLSGQIAVDGIVASCYTTAIPPRLAHVLLFPERIAYLLGHSVIGTFFHQSQVHLGTILRSLIPSPLG